MAVKFPTRRPETSEIAHPDDLNLNFKEFVDEINGNLDSDNLKDQDSSGIDKDCFSVGSFTECFQDGNDFLNFKCSHNTTGFLSTDDNGNSLPSIEFHAESDGWIIVDFSVSHQWRGNGFTSLDEAKKYMEVVFGHFQPFGISSKGDADIRGNPSHPPGGWLAVSGSNKHALDDDLFISDIFAKGTITARSGPRFTHRHFPQGRWIAKPIDRYAVQYKVEVNGNDIAETGWLFNGNKHQGTYLCGCIPVVAGKNRVVTSVRAVSHFELNASPRGIGHADDSGHKGEYVPRQTVVTMDGLSPLPIVRSVRGPFADVPSAGAAQRTTIDIGIECLVNSSNLVVQYRKA